MAAERVRLTDKSIYLALARYQKDSGIEIQLKFIKSAVCVSHGTAWKHWDEAKKEVEMEASGKPFTSMVSSKNEKEGTDEGGKSGHKRKRDEQATKPNATQTNGPENRVKKSRKKGTANNQDGKELDGHVVKTEPGTEDNNVA
ncbi:MAG: hypothetical protein Q9162_001201 [Coniocarpon cinnabarinum]